MNIIVCVKEAPHSESEVIISKDEKGVEREILTLGINEWDKYALEEGIRIKEDNGGKVTVISLGSNSDDVLWESLAMGADEAIKISQDTFLDGHNTAKMLADVIKEMDYDLILTGLMAADTGNAQVGVMLASMLGIPHATIVTGIEMENGKLTARRELEGGLEEKVEVDLPCVLTIQSGINEPRYVSIMGIKRAKKKELIEKEGIKGEEYAELIRLYKPPVSLAEMIEGSPDEVAEKLLEIFKERGLI
jgi:electron transfer flavoprotein beta subunit